MQTTLNKIRAYGATQRYHKLLEALGKTSADDEPLTIIKILEVAGPDTAVWCLRAVTGYDAEIRKFAIWCARQIPNDTLADDALAVAEAFADGTASETDRANARQSLAVQVDRHQTSRLDLRARAAWYTTEQQPGWAAWGAAGVFRLAASGRTLGQPDSHLHNPTTGGAVDKALTEQLKEMCATALPDPHLG